MKAFPSYSNNSSIKCEGCFAYDSNCQECGKLNARFPKNNVEIVGRLKNPAASSTLLKTVSNGELREKKRLRNGKISPEIR